MACERGCQGTPICNALDICCIQFRQDCGKECDGLAVGFSDIQFNDVGELVICSNVAGVCTCVSPSIGTDTLVDNVDGTYTHTTVDGDVVVIDICTALNLGGCRDLLVNNLDGTYTHTDVLGNPVIIDICTAVGLGGCTDVLVDNLDNTYTHTALDGTAVVIDTDCLVVVDTNCMDLTYDPATCELQVDPIIDPDLCNSFECRDDGLYAPSVHVVSESVQTPDFIWWTSRTPLPAGAQALPAAGVIADVLSAEVVVNNPSDCCEMELKVDYQPYQLYAYGDAQFQGIAQLGRWEMNLNPHYQIDGADQAGGPFVNTGTIYENLDPNAIFASETATSPFSTSTTIAAGGSVTLRTSADLDVLFANNMLDIVVQTAGISAFGICSG